MQVKLNNKVAWVTGGGAGVGEAVCRRLAACGAKVLCTDIDGNAAQKVADSIHQQGGVAHGMSIDVTQENDNAAAVEWVFNEWGGLHMVAINAAIDAARGKDILSCSLEEMRRTADVNYFGSFLGIKHAAQGMKDHNIKGHILVIGSGTSIKATPGTFAYSSSKHGLIGIAKLAATELLPEGIRVNTACLGMVDTKGLRDALAQFGVEGVPDYVDGADLVAEEVVNLMANDSPLVTGQVIGLERGLSNTQYMAAVIEHGNRSNNEV
ncbi:SDR family NAD(P)-dependent oxidoreductase [Agarilytica rhodophyticola]|uniref:SDR family NAD(P)-dependent oxidoreductase n=1 Tax=Agarilytica rhodophyticola TaxID=1737490 RepID=UPI000B3464C9|nr:SDR family oxidoreductase [Agarilytica rhodophyticola]